jgi:signal transduction histidine kinase
MAGAAASLQSHVELILGSSLDDLSADQRRLLEAGWRNGRRLLGLIEALETLTLAEAGQLESEWTTVDLTELSKRAVEQAWPVAKSEAKPIRVEPAGHALATGASPVIAQSLDALVEYVVEHARRGQEIVVSVEADTITIGYAAARVSTPHELPVSLAAAVCRAHGGEMTTLHENGWATFTLRYGHAGEGALAA